MIPGLFSRENGELENVYKKHMISVPHIVN